MEKKIIICILSTKEECDFRSSYDRTCKMKSGSKYVVQSCPYQYEEKHSPDWKEPEPKEESLQSKLGEPF
jgi:hypothetical protein